MNVVPSIRWMLRVQLRDTGAIRISDVRCFETRGQSVYLELGERINPVERVLLEKLSGESHEIVFDASGDAVALDHVTEFLATRP